MSSDNRALGGLPSADTMLLNRAPLELAIAEIRFAPASVTSLPAEIGLALRNRLRELGHDFPRVDVANEGRVTFQVMPGVTPVPQVEQTSSGWQMLSADSRVQVTVLPGSAVVQTSKYERWSVSLRPLLTDLLTAIEEMLRPAMVSRLGLRYINRFADADAAKASAWRGRIDDRLLGPLCHPIFGGMVSAAQQQVELRFDDAAGAQGAILRHGPFVDGAAKGTVSYLLDIDVFDGETRAFAAADLVNRCETLNRTSASLFKAALTPDYLAIRTGSAMDMLDSAETGRGSRDASQVAAPLSGGGTGHGSVAESAAKTTTSADPTELRDHPQESE